MLDQLPAEIIYQISAFLPSATSIINLSLVNRRVYLVMSQNDYSGFKHFVERSFPTIKMTPRWKENACNLTTRARAFAKAAFVARIITPNNYLRRIFPNGGGSASTTVNDPRRIVPSATVGHAPAIDSYEDWRGAMSSHKHKVVAWGDAGMVVIQIKGAGSTKSVINTFPGDRLPQSDVLDLHLLRPDQRTSEMLEEVIIRRANGQIAKLKQNSQDELSVSTDFTSTGGIVQCLDVSRSRTPLVAACGPHNIQIFNGGSQDRHSSPISSIPSTVDLGHPYRLRCAKFLGEDRLATTVQFLDGNSPAPINIHHITPDGLRVISESSFLSNTGNTLVDSLTRTCSNTIAPLDDVGTLAGRPGEVFLSGCSDLKIRLHDIRIPNSSVGEYGDGVDGGQVLSILPIGHERFLAAGAENACIKIFDLRMTRAIMYSHFTAKNGQVTSLTQQPQPLQISRNRPGTKSDRELNILLGIQYSHRHRRGGNGWDWRPRYRGPVYSLSSPSPTSPTVYAGIERHVVQFDFVSTDDLQTRRSSLSNAGFDMPKEESDDVLSLSCYERPRRGFEMTDPVTLMTQVEPNEVQGHGNDGSQGWDQRWAVAGQRRN